MRFYLGTDRLTWLWDRRFTEVPLFVSHRALRDRVSPYPRATTSYAVDSGAYTELSRHGRWTETPEQYVAALRRYAAELGPFDFAGQQDSMCAPDVLAVATTAQQRPVTVDDHLHATVENYLRLVEIAPDLPIAPTIQGWRFEDYLRCADLFAAAGVDLAAAPVVGLGSVVRQTPAQIERLVTTLAARGIVGVHGFGVKEPGIRATGHAMASADSQAWSFAGRKRPLPDCSHDSCAHCARFALRWRDEVLSGIDVPAQLGFAV